MAIAKSQNFKLARQALRHAIDMSDGHQHGAMLLAGDPGIGKTTFVEIFAQLLGVKAVVIEVPHVTEEHLINIPFVVVNDNGSKQGGISKGKPSADYSMVLADSHLYQQLTTAKVMDDKQYIEHIKKAPAAVQELYRAMGGSDSYIPEEIAEARQVTRVILFLDEFYRYTSPRIRNIMRGMLNGKIGMHSIPRNVYMMYASNMNDEGLEGTPNNAQFAEMDFKPPTKQDWFDYLIKKYESDKHIQLNHKILDKFKEILEDKDLTFKDVQAYVRTSPRRWEQLILYINSSFPVQEVSEARALLANVRNQFIHYQSGAHSSLANKVVQAVQELIKDTSGFDLKQSDEYTASEWKQNIEHLLKQQIKTNGKRKHVPVVSGPPGIAKTHFMAQLAAKHNLRFIDIDVGKLFAEDAIGLPIPGEKRKDEKGDVEGIGLRFSVPMLYHWIMNDIKKADKAYLDELIEKYGEEGAKQKVEEYKKQPFKYLIFLDELNRPDEKTFNALRRVLLEKNFGPDDDGNLMELPKESLMVGAINPEGAGTTELTEHFRDVIDVVPAVGSWTQIREHLLKRKQKRYPQEMNSVAMGVIDTFVKKFKSSDKDGTYPADQAPFHLDIGGTKVYVSAREYTDMFTSLIREINAGIKDALADPDVKENQIRGIVDDHISHAMQMSLRFPIRKAGIDPEEFLQTLETWIETIPDAVFGGMLKKKSKNVTAFASTIEKYLDGHDLMQMPEDEHIVNANNTSSNDQIMEEIREALRNKVTDDASVQKYFLDTSHPMITMKNEQLTTDPTQKVSLIANMFLALLYTLHINNYPHDRIGSLGKAMNTQVSETRKTLVKDQHISADIAKQLQMAAAELRSTLLDVAEAL